MAIFISYARHDRPAVEVLARDLERTRESVWMDNELTGGQAWWDTILGQIRSCDLYILALSPESLRSRACRLELDYALAVGRPLLPVQIADLAITTAPQVVADTQIVDYRQRTPEAGFALVAAVVHRPSAPPLPVPLPPEPAPPMSYMHEFSEQVDATVLSYRDQNHLLTDLRGYLSEEDDRATALQLIRALRGRRDISMSVAQEIDGILDAERRGSSPEPTRATLPSQSPPPQTQPSPGYPPSQQAPAQPQPTPTYQQPPRTQPTPPTYQQPPRPQPTPPTHQQPPRPQPTPPTHQQPPRPQPTPPTYQQPPAAFYQPTPPPAYPPPAAYQPVPGGTAPPPAPGRPPGPHSYGVVVLVLAILGPFFCGVTGIIALVLASRALKEIDANPRAYTNRSLIATARIVAWVGLAIAVVFYFIYFAYYGI